MSKCNRIEVPKDCCFISFGKSDYKHSDADFSTIRGEQLIIDFDSNGLVTAIELLSSKEAKKPCQSSEHVKGEESV